MKLLVCLLCLFFNLLLTGSSTAQQLPPDLEMAAGKTSFSIPFELVDNRIFIAVRINGKGPYHFLLDSGGFGSISMQVARELDLPLGEEARGAGAGQNVVVAR